MHTIIDIIRPLADKEYLDRVARQCFNAGAGQTEFDGENFPNGLQNRTKSNGDKKKLA